MNRQVNRLSNDKLLEILSLSQNATAIYTEDDIIIQMANDAMIAFWGKDRSIIGMPLAEAVPELEGQPFIGILQQVWRTGITYESRNTAAELLIDGRLQTFYFDFIYRAITNEQGKTECILHTATDVTELNQGRQAMLEVEAQKAALDREQAINEKTAAANKALQQTQNQLYELNTELEQRITSRTKELLEREAVMDLAVDIAHFGIFILQIQQGQIKLSEQAQQVFGLEAKPIISLEDFLQLYDPQYYQPVQEALKKAINQNTDCDFSYTIYLPATRERKWVRVLGKPLQNEAGATDQFMGVITDITEEVKTRENLQDINEELSVINEELRATNDELREVQIRLLYTNEQLKESEYNLNAAFEAGELGSCSVDLQTKKVELSPRFRAMYGLPLRGPIIWEDVLEAVDTNYLPVVNAAFSNCIEFGKPVDSTYPIVLPLTKERRWMRVVAKLRKGANSEAACIFGIVMDVTKQVKALQAVAESEEKLKLAIETGKMGTWSINLENMKVTMSDFVRNLLGILPNQEPQMELMMQAIDAEYHPMLTAALNDAIQNRKSSDNEYSIHNLVSGEKKWVRATGKVFLDADGKGGEYAGMFMDITEQKLDDQRKNDFIGMVSHELKTPLTSIGGYVQVLQARAAKANDLVTSSMLDKTYSQVRKMTTMINGFLNMSRLESGKIQLEKTSFSIDELVQEIIEEAATIQPKHTLYFSPDHSITVNADRDKISSVVSNLLSNAIKYSPNNKNITIRCEAVGNTVVVSVKDEGIGIAPEDAEKLFERYYRVKGDPSISGFGIGLYLCVEIVQRHGGKIWVESEAGKGSTFYFSLPLNNKQ